MIFEMDSYRTQGMEIRFTGKDYPRAWIDFSAPDLESARREDTITISKGLEFNLWDSIPSKHKTSQVMALVSKAQEESWERIF